MAYQARQQRRARSVTHMPMQTDWLRSKESSKRLTVAIGDIVDMVLESRGRFVQESPELSDVCVDGFRDGVFACEEGAEGVVEVEVGEVLWVGFSAGGTARGGYFRRMIGIFWVVTVTLKIGFLARTKDIGFPDIRPLYLVSLITGRTSQCFRLLL